MQLGLSSADVGLNQHATGLTVWDYAMQTSLESRAAPKNNDGGYLACWGEAAIWEVLRRDDGFGCKEDVV